MQEKKLDFKKLYIKSKSKKLILKADVKQTLKLRYKELTWIPNLWEKKKKKKIEKTHAKEKQSHAQDNIYVVRQFAYDPGVAGISLLSRKNTKVQLQFFSLPKKHDNQRKP